MQNTEDQNDPSPGDAGRAGMAPAPLGEALLGALAFFTRLPLRPATHHPLAATLAGFAPAGAAIDGVALRKLVAHFVANDANGGKGNAALESTGAAPGQGVVRKYMTDVIVGCADCSVDDRRLFIQYRRTADAASARGNAGPGVGDWIGEDERVVVRNQFEANRVLAAVDLVDVRQHRVDAGLYRFRSAGFLCVFARCRDGQAQYQEGVAARRVGSDKGRRCVLRGRGGRDKHR